MNARKVPKNLGKTASAGRKNLGGRPRKVDADEKTLATLKGLGQIQATTKECAAVLGVSEPTFMAFLNRSPEARVAYNDGKQEGRASLRRTQFRLAERNAAMAIFLGKNFLGQTDRQEHQHSGAVGTYDLTKVSDEQIDQLETILGPVADNRGDQGGEAETHH